MGVGAPAAPTALMDKRRSQQAFGIRDAIVKVRAVMPRYYFHLEGSERIADKRGRDLPDDNAAGREAEGISAALQRSRGRVWSVIVTNEWGHKVVEILSPRTSPLVKEHLAQRRVTEE
jgi:hypothetical protein